MPTDGNRSIYNLDEAHLIACEQLAKTDIEQQCQRSGAQYQVQDSQKVVTIKYLNQSYQFTLPDIDVSLAGSDEKVPIRDRVLILHYFIRAKGTAVTNKFVNFRELPGGNVYYPTFYKRTVNPLTRYFGTEPALLVTSSQRLGGNETDYGDTAVTINAFSRVPITIILWQGDDELTPQLNLLFDATISDYLETEDITVLCENLTWRLISYVRGA